MRVLIIFCICYLVWYLILYLRHVNEEKIEDSIKLNSFSSLKSYIYAKKFALCCSAYQK